jgi:hypothetical protein
MSNCVRSGERSNSIEFSKGEGSFSTLPPCTDVVINVHCPFSRETKYSRAPSETIWLPGASRPVCVSCVTLRTCGSDTGQ